VGKNKQSPYTPGKKTKAWLKIKTGDMIQGVIAGFIIDEEKGGKGLAH
jgi:ATP-dependent DNA ligase